MRIKCGHANGCGLRCLLPRQPSACPSWTCFLCILLVANENIMHLKLTAARARGLSFPLHTPLSLSLCVCSVKRAVKTQICCFSNFTCKYSRNHSTAILFILCVAYLISSDDVTIINQDFVQINILEGSWLCSLNGSRFSHYFIFISLSDNRNRKIYQWNTVLLRI